MTTIIKPNDPEYTPPEFPKRKGFLCIGRIVHYFPYDEAKPRPALIVYVHNTDAQEVNLVAFEPDGESVAHIKVKHSGKPKGECWSWPHDGR